MSKKKAQSITAIIFDKRGRPISIGKNSYHKTHPLQAKIASEVGLPSKKYLHAEVDALIRLNDWSRAHEIHVMRYGSKGEPLLAKPCPICQRLLDKAGVKRIFYTKPLDN